VTLIEISWQIGNQAKRNVCGFDVKNNIPVKGIIF